MRWATLMVSERVFGCLTRTSIRISSFKSAIKEPIKNSQVGRLPYVRVAQRLLGRL